MPVQSAAMRVLPPFKYNTNILEYLFRFYQYVLQPELIFDEKEDIKPTQVIS